MKHLILIFLVLAGCAVGPRASEKDIKLVFAGSYAEACQAWTRLMKSDFLAGKSRTTVLDRVGKPDYTTLDAICYKTAAGPLWFEFSGDQMVGAHLVSTPPRWRGTRAEAEVWWKESRDTKDWYAY